jgi:threonine synthase
MLRVLRETGGGAVAVDDDKLSGAAHYGTMLEGIDFSPEGGAAIAAAAQLKAEGLVGPEEAIIAFNTGAGWLYRPEAAAQ